MERAYLEKYGQDRHISNRAAQEDFDYSKQSFESHLKFLDSFLSLAGTVCPLKESFLSKPTIRHPESNPSNIIVSDSFDIQGLFDWQHCCISPLFLQTYVPMFLQNWQDEASCTLTPPEVPNLDGLDEEDS